MWKEEAGGNCGPTHREGTRLGEGAGQLHRTWPRNSCQDLGRWALGKESPPHGCVWHFILASSWVKPQRHSFHTAAAMSKLHLAIPCLAFPILSVIGG